MRLTTSSMLQIARDMRIDDRHAADRRRPDLAPDGSPSAAMASIGAGRSERPTGMRRLISLGLRV